MRKGAANMGNVKDAVFIEVKTWDRMNPAMYPVDVPYGCKAVYRYQQPIIHKGPEELPNDSIFISFGDWGVVTIQSDYVMTPQEKEERQEALKNEGAVIIGNMRLTSQTFSRDNDTISIDDLGDMLSDE